MEATRAASLSKVEALRVTTAARGDWLGDDTLVRGMTELEVEYADLLGGTVLGWCAPRRGACAPRPTSMRSTP